MAYWQKRFYNPKFSFAATKHNTQWQKLTTEMTTEIIMKTKTETTTRIMLTDKDLMVWSLIRSQRLGRALVLWRRIGQQQQRRCRLDKLCIYAFDYNLRYIFPINTIVKIFHKRLYKKMVLLNLCWWNTKTITSYINNRIDYIFEIYKGIPIIFCP